MIGRLFQSINRRYAIRKNVSFQPDIHVGIGTIIWASESLCIDRNVYIGKYCTIQVNGKIGKGVLIANQVGLIGRRDHDFRQIGSPIRNARWIGECESLSRDKANWLMIEDDVWVGFGVTILSGVTVAKGTIISAGSVVRSDTRSYDIVSGNPAKPVGRRFRNEADIATHEAGLSRFYARR